MKNLFSKVILNTAAVMVLIFATNSQVIAATVCGSGIIERVGSSSGGESRQFYIFTVLATGSPYYWRAYDHWSKSNTDAQAIATLNRTYMTALLAYKTGERVSLLAHDCNDRDTLIGLVFGDS